MMKNLLVLAALGLSGCLSCTLMYAPSTFTVQVVGAAPVEGLFQLEANGQGQTGMCVFVLPHREDDLVSCTQNAMVNFEGDGSAVDSLVLFNFSPEFVNVRALLDGEEVASQSFEPEYAVDEPNGRGCGERSIGSVVFDSSRQGGR